MFQNTDSLHTRFTAYQVTTDEEYMGVKQTAHFKQILLTWRQELTQDFDLTVNNLQHAPTNHADPLDQAAQTEEMSLELHTRNRESRLIRKIDQALERIHEEDYGYCDTCGIEIGVRRLEARPTAELCIDCKSVAEVKERTFA